MKIGIKVYRNSKELDYFKDKADFIEVMAIEGADYSWLNDWKIPIVIHAQHQRFGVNNADLTKKDKNISSIKFAISLADKFKSKKIILHPGVIENSSCSLKNAEDSIKTLDKRIIIENLPSIETFPKSRTSLCSNSEETKDLMQKTGKGICFDINHSIETATDLKKDPYFDLLNFIKLKPIHYHIGGQKLNGESHLSFSDSEIDLKKIFSLFPKDAEISLETSIDLEKLKEDLRIVKELANTFC